jgi:hypothetical protein
MVIEDIFISMPVLIKSPPRFDKVSDIGEEKVGYCINEHGLVEALYLWTIDSLRARDLVSNFLLWWNHKIGATTAVVGIQ